MNLTRGRDYDSLAGRSEFIWPISKAGDDIPAVNRGKGTKAGGWHGEKDWWQMP